MITNILNIYCAFQVVYNEIFLQICNNHSQMIHLSFRKYEGYIKPACVGMALLRFKTYCITHNLLCKSLCHFR